MGVTWPISDALIHINVITRFFSTNRNFPIFISKNSDWFVFFFKLKPTISCQRDKGTWECQAWPQCCSFVVLTSFPAFVVCQKFAFRWEIFCLTFIVLREFFSRLVTFFWSQTVFLFLFFFLLFWDSTTVSQKLTPSGYNFWVMWLVTKLHLNQSDWGKNLDLQIWFDDEVIGLTVSCTKFSRDQSHHPTTKNWKKTTVSLREFPPVFKTV